MSNGKLVFISKQKYILYFVSGLLWLVGMAIFRYFDGLSILAFIALSLTLIASVFHTSEIKWWVNIAVIVIGIFLIGMSYLERTDPIGVMDVKEWWLFGIIAILVRIYWLVQRVLAW